MKVRRYELMEKYRIPSMAAVQTTGVVMMYEAYSESKGRLVSKKNIFVRHIFY